MGRRGEAGKRMARFSLRIDYPLDEMRRTAARNQASARRGYADRVPVGFCITPRIWTPVAGIALRGAVPRRRDPLRAAARLPEMAHRARARRPPRRPRAEREPVLRQRAERLGLRRRGARAGERDPARAARGARARGHGARAAARARRRLLGEADRLVARHARALRRHGSLLRRDARPRRDGSPLHRRRGPAHRRRRPRRRGLLPLAGRPPGGVPRVPREDHRGHGGRRAAHADHRSAAARGVRRGRGLGPGDVRGHVPHLLPALRRGALPRVRRGPG